MVGKSVNNNLEDCGCEVVGLVSLEFACLSMGWATGGGWRWLIRIANEARSETPRQEVAIFAFTSKTKAVGCYTRLPNFNCKTDHLSAAPDRCSSCGRKPRSAVVSSTFRSFTFRNFPGTKSSLFRCRQTFPSSRLEVMHLSSKS